ncbi:hypothetical protein [Pararhizobium qamdonense]|uniref:hypothetical protein n=1 Tax=Pararhizobium qamdonense TaxID=3031126 RepID=UPI0023E2421E|nr:hypothetical protein [Pararhizobium qamdonense]
MSNATQDTGDLPIAVQDHAIHLAKFLTEKTDKLGLKQSEQLIYGSFVTPEGKERKYEVTIKDLGFSA